MLCVGSRNRDHHKTDFGEGFAKSFYTASVVPEKVKKKGTRRSRIVVER